MQDRRLNLKFLNNNFGIAKLASTQEIPEWVMKNDIYSITRTSKELTIVCPESSIPTSIKYDGKWKCIKVQGSYNFEEIGIISSLSNTLSQNGISIYIFSSYDTDYILIKEKNIEKARKALNYKGHVFIQ